MSKKAYTLIIIAVVAGMVVAGITAIPKNSGNITQAPDLISMPGVLIESFNISGSNLKGFGVNKTWGTVGVLVIYDPSTLGKDSYVRLYDPHIVLQQDFGVEYENVPRGTIDKSGVTINIGPPMNGPYGTWVIAYNLPNNADVEVQIYKTPLNNTS